MNLDPPLPVDMNAFWASNSNKCKLQKLLATYVINNAEEKLPNTQVVISAFSWDVQQNCQSVYNNIFSSHRDLDLEIEEADASLMSHTLDTAKMNHDRFIILSSDVLV